MDVDLAVVKYDIEVQMFVANAQKHERVLVPFGYDTVQENMPTRVQWFAAMFADTSRMVAIVCLCERRPRSYVLETLIVKGNNRQREVILEQIFQELKIDMTDEDVIICCGLSRFPGCRILHTLCSRRGTYHVMYLCKEDLPSLDKIKAWRLLDSRNPSARPNVSECSHRDCDVFGTVKCQKCDANYCSSGCLEVDQARHAKMCF